MGKLEDLEQVAEKLGDGGPFNPDTNFKTVEEVVDALVGLGNTDKVFAHHDDHLGLKSDLSKEFLETSLDEISEYDNQEKFEEEIKEVLDQANTIIRLSERNLSEDDLEEIREDRLSRGEDIDD